MTDFVPLPHGGPGAQFPVSDLVAHIRRSGRDYIIQGQVNCFLDDHPKPHSLDVWLRTQYAAQPDTKQAVNQVIDDLVATGLFEPGTFVCPDSGRHCKGIMLVGNG